MERDSLIKLFALLAIAFFVLEMFTIRSSVTGSTTQSSDNNGNESAVYGAANTTATLLLYSDYLNVFKSGVDITGNASLNDLGSIGGVGYVNRQGGSLALVLEQGADASEIARSVKERFPDLNVTAKAVFSLPPEVEFLTAAGRRNISTIAAVSLEIEPELGVGDNVTLSLTGLISGNKFNGVPIARIIPTEGEAVTNAMVSRVGEGYSAAVMLPWGKRNVNASELKENLSKDFENVSIDYAPESFVAVRGLNSAEEAVVGSICAPSPFQKAAIAALDYDVSDLVDAYKRKRDLIYDGLGDKFDMVKPGGAFYAFVKAPAGGATKFVEKAIANNVLVIPGNVFSEKDTHFRISYATSDKKIEQGIEILRKLA